MGKTALGAVHAALAGHGEIDVLGDVRQLLSELEYPNDACIVLDPALVSATAAEHVVHAIQKHPRYVVAYSSTTMPGIEIGAVLSRIEAIRFVFRGTPNERTVLQRALLLTPNSAMASALLLAVDDNLSRLPQLLRERISNLFRGTDGPASSDALAAASGITRRSLDRRVPDAGFVSARAIIEAARIAWAYRAITESVIPLGRIAAMLGYTSSRTMDQQLKRLMDTTGSKLREQPLPVPDATQLLVQHLLVPNERASCPVAPFASEQSRPVLKLIDGGARSRRGTRIISPESRTKP